MMNMKKPPYEKLDFEPLPDTDLSPFSEPILWKAERFGTGYRAIARLRINFRWDTECEWIEKARIFGHKGDLSEEEKDKELKQNLQDLWDKLVWIYKANHGMLDHNNIEIRFKA